MSADRYAALATRLLRAARRASSLEIGDRARGVAAVEQALQTRVRRRRLARGLAIGAAASLAIAAAFALHRWPTEVRDERRAAAPPAPLVTAALRLGTAASVMRAGARAAVATGATLEAGDELRADRDGAQVALSTGTRLLVGPEARLELLALGPRGRLALRAGRVRADVARLAAGERFVLETADAEIEVRGTSFEVAIVPQPGCPGGVTTRVDVFEGVAQVRSGHEQASETVSLRAGASWLHTCAPIEKPERVMRPRPLARGPAASLAPALQEGSTLAAENDLFEAALLAERTGDVAAALRHLDELLVRFPRGSLAGAAREQRLRLARRPSTPEAR